MKVISFTKSKHTNARRKEKGMEKKKEKKPEK